MSRNRNLRSFNSFVNNGKFDFAKYPRNATLSPIYCVGECINKQSCQKGQIWEKCSSGDSDFLNYISDESSIGKTYSSSSISWAEDCEEEGGKLVENELRKMENALCGKEAIPKNYDVDEYKLWMKMFPTMRLLGIQEKHCRRNKSTSKIRTLKRFSSNNSGSKGSIEKISLDKYESASVVFAEQKDGTIKHKKKANVEKTQEETDDFNLKPLDAQFENLLKISRAPVVDTPIRNLESRRHSNVLAKSQNSASKWLRNDSPEFLSMPYLTVEQISPRLPRDFSARSIKTKYKPEKSRLPIARNKILKHSPRSTVILPPIKQAYVNSSQYRSISATPTQQNKSSSAISVGSFLGRLKKPNFIKM